VKYALVLLLVLAGCTAKQEEEQAADAVVAVHAEAVTDRTFRDMVEAPGRWRNSNALSVRAPAAGVIESLGPKPGDRVGTGQVVGRILTRESKAALEGAEILSRSAHTAAARAEAKQALALARRELVHVPLVAGHSGIVIARMAEPGAQVDEGADVLQLVAPEDLVFEAHVPAKDGSRIRPGQDATILVDSATPRAATVRTVLPMADSTDQSTVVWLTSSAAGAPPALERFGAARIAVGAPHVSPSVPEAALVEDDLTGAPKVAVIDSSGRASWTTLKVGALTDGWREVISPRLAPGTKVVTEGQHGLEDRTRVEVTR
jgi:multidrug efflux pump subunit AcrA (membrane-fusion protein)